MENKQKPKAELIGADGNIFNLIGIASKTLKRHGQYDQSNEMAKRVFNSNSYNEALNIITEYVEPVEVGYEYNDYEEDYDYDMEME